VCVFVPRTTAEKVAFVYVPPYVSLSVCGCACVKTTMYLCVRESVSTLECACKYVCVCVHV